MSAIGPSDSSWRDLPIEVRERAVDDATEPVLLVQVAISDRDPRLGLRAVARIGEETLLAEVVCSGAEFAVLEAALSRVHARDLLAKIARDAKYSYIRAGAVGRIDDQPLLAEIATTSLCTITSRAAAERIKGRKLLAVVAQRAVSRAARFAAITKVTGGALLVRIARQDPDAMVRKAAVQRLHDAQTLAQIAFEDPDPGVRTVAIGRVADQGILARVALSNPHPQARQEATARIKDKAVLVRIAFEDAVATVRRAAVSGITDQDMLTQIARDDADPRVRIAAVERTKRRVLTQLAGSDREPSVRAAAIRRVSNKRVLVAHARGDPNPEVRRVATDRLDDEALLADIAENDSDDGVQRTAVRQLHDEERLSGFLAHASPVVRLEAAFRLLELDLAATPPDALLALGARPFMPLRSDSVLRSGAGSRFALRSAAALRRSDVNLRSFSASGGLAEFSLEASGAGEAAVLDQVASTHRSKTARRAAIAQIEVMRAEQPGALREIVRDVALPQPLAAARRGRSSQVAGAEPVDFSVFGPPALAVGSAMMLQIFLHKPEQATEAAGLARAFDTAAERRGFASLETDLELGSRVAFQVAVPGLEIDEPVKQVVWRGRTASVQFAVSAPDRLAAQTIIGKVCALQDGIPIGHILFKLEVVEGAPTAEERDLGDMARRYRYAFVSYASGDRKEVLKRVQMLEVAGIEFFQDLIKLKPGQRWQRELYRKIDQSDLFLLFWSKAAKRSRWVLKEVRYALDHKGGDEEAPPEIFPVILPPRVDPPPDLAHLHFNDPIIYFMQ